MACSSSAPVSATRSLSQLIQYFHVQSPGNPSDHIAILQWARSRRRVCVPRRSVHLIGSMINFNDRNLWQCQKFHYQDTGSKEITNRITRLQTTMYFQGYVILDPSVAIMCRRLPTFTQESILENQEIRRRPIKGLLRQPHSTMYDAFNVMTIFHNADII